MASFKATSAMSSEKPLKLVLKVAGSSFVECTQVSSIKSVKRFESTPSLSSSSSPSSSNHFKRVKKEKHSLSVPQHCDSASENCESSNDSTSVQIPMNTHVENRELPVVDASSAEQKLTVKKKKITSLQSCLKILLKELENLDVDNFFKHEIDDELAPGYSTVICHPMNFECMLAKIEANEYESVLMFEKDFKLICDNAMLYNHCDTIYYKAAKKLLCFGSRLLSKQNLRSLAISHPCISHLTKAELGSSLLDEDTSDVIDNVDTHGSNNRSIQSNQEGGSGRVMPRLERPSRLSANSFINFRRNKFEAFVDRIPAADILSHNESAAKRAQEKLLEAYPEGVKLGYLNQNAGTENPTFNFISSLPNSSNQGPEMQPRVAEVDVSELWEPVEDSRNNISTLKYLDYGLFHSYAPYVDSTFCNVSQEVSERLSLVYGDEGQNTFGLEYAQSIQAFLGNINEYSQSWCDRLLNSLTNNAHTEVSSILHDSIFKKKFHAPQHPTLERAKNQEDFLNKNPAVSSMEKLSSFLSSIN